MDALSILYVSLAFGDVNQAQTTQVNGLIPSLPTMLQACTSPGFFNTATSDADITASLDAMFNQALQMAHLSQ